MGSHPQTAPTIVTTKVVITITLNSTATAPPYYATGISVSITTYDGSAYNTSTVTGWSLEDVGTPQTGGAPLGLSVVDSGYVAYNASSVAAWEINFLPRAGTTRPAPLPGGQTTGGAVTSTNGTFVLINPTSNSAPKLTSSGGTQQFWDWSVMVQMSVPQTGGTSIIKTFVNDPEMEMDG